MIGLHGKVKEVSIYHGALLAFIKHPETLCSNTTVETFIQNNIFLYLLSQFQLCKVPSWLRVCQNHREPSTKQNKPDLYCMMLLIKKSWNNLRSTQEASLSLSLELSPILTILIALCFLSFSQGFMWRTEISHCTSLGAGAAVKQCWLQESISLREPGRSICPKSRCYVFAQQESQACDLGCRKEPLMDLNHSHSPSHVLRYKV